MGAMRQGHIFHPVKSTRGKVGGKRQTRQIPGYRIGHEPTGDGRSDARAKAREAKPEPERLKEEKSAEPTIKERLLSFLRAIKPGAKEGED